jgi:hypothetical protein
MKLTRRQLAAAAVASIAAQAQTPAPPRSPSLTSEAELQAARDKVKAMAELLSGIPVPMTVEPAFAFRV